MKQSAAAQLARMRSQSLTPEQRREIARNAADARWRKQGKKKAASSPTGFLSRELRPRRKKLLEQILALRDSLKAEKGILPESYPLIREDRER